MKSSSFRILLSITLSAPISSRLLSCSSSLHLLLHPISWLPSLHQRSTIEDCREETYDWAFDLFLFWALHPHQHPSILSSAVFPCPPHLQPRAMIWPRRAANEDWTVEDDSLLTVAVSQKMCLLLKSLGCMLIGKRSEPRGDVFPP